MAAPVILGLDVGTTAVKCAAFEVGGPGTVIVSLDLPATDDWTAPDPEDVASTAISALARGREAVADREVLAVSLSTAMHGLIGLDARHRPVTPLFTWAHGGADAWARAELADDQRADLLARTGTPVHPMSPLVKLRWLAAQHPDTVSGVHAWWGLKEWILWRLTGEVAVDRSSASATGLLRIGDTDWDDDALAWAGVRADALPAVVSPLARFRAQGDGRAALGGDIPVVIGGADGPLAHLGVAGCSPADASLSIGTSAAVRALAVEPTVGDGSLFCYYALDDLHVIGRALSNGGSAVRSALGLCGAGLDEEAALALAARVPAGADGVVVDPQFVTERHPLWPHDQGARITGLRSSHRVEHVVRATVEGVSRNVADAVGALARNVPVRRIIATGGVFRSPVWSSIIAAHVPVPVHVVSDAGGAARGAALVAARSLGLAADLAAAGALIAGATQDVASVPVDAHAAAAYCRELPAVGEGNR